jgi:hypothetical protein
MGHPASLLLLERSRSFPFGFAQGQDDKFIYEFQFCA